MAEETPAGRLQARLLPVAEPEVGASTRLIFQRIKQRMDDACGDILETGPHALAGTLKLSKNELAITCGGVNQRRDKAMPHVRRTDQAWFDFRITFSSAKPALLNSYGVEIRFPREHFPAGWPAWVRFDLNPPGHANDMQDIRSHLHPGFEDLQLPSAVLFPDEIVDLLLDGFKPRREIGRSD